MAAGWFLLGIGGLIVLAAALVAVLVLATPAPEPTSGWEALADLPEPRGEVASTVVDGGDQLVVAGGLEGLTASTSAAVHRFDGSSGSWETLPNLPEPRHHAAAAAIDGAIYVTGGAPSVTEWTAQDTLWVLEGGASAWERLAPMPEGRDSHRMRAIDGQLYVIGGHGPSSDVLIYDPDGDRWTRGAALPTPRHHLAVIVLDGELWAIGGRDDDDTVLDAVHIWDPGDDRWREGPALPMPVSAAIEGVIDGRIHLAGGEDPAVFGGEVIDHHLSLDPEEGTWRRSGSVPLPVHGAGGGVLGQRLVVAGGAARQGALSPVSWTDFTGAFDPTAD